MLKLRSVEDDFATQVQHFVRFSVLFAVPLGLAFQALASKLRFLTLFEATASVLRKCCSANLLKRCDAVIPQQHFVAGAALCARWRSWKLNFVAGTGSHKCVIQQCSTRVSSNI